MSGLWETPEIARAYAELRSELAGRERVTWTAAFREAAPPPPLGRLLDVGCGTGRFTALLHDVFGGAVVGVDASHAMLGQRPPTDRSLAFAGGDAQHLPVRGRAIDVALLSMVYHLLASPPAALAELHRVVRPEGRVLVRTPTRELLDRVSFLAFFPEARAVDEARMPTRAALAGAFTAAGFALHSHATIEQEFAPSPAAALEKVRRRPFSTLRLIPDAAFEAGLARYEAHCRDAAPGPLMDPLDFFVFRRA